MIAHDRYRRPIALRYRRRLPGANFLTDDKRIGELDCDAVGPRRTARDDGDVGAVNLQLDFGIEHITSDSYRGAAPVERFVDQRRREKPGIVPDIKPIALDHR